MRIIGNDSRRGCKRKRGNAFARKMIVQRRDEQAAENLFRGVMTG
jgi:hypothetical protein